jgi:hypothetical protein
MPQIRLYLARHHHTPYGGLVLVEKEIDPLERISVGAEKRLDGVHDLGDQ